MPQVEESVRQLGEEVAGLRDSLHALRLSAAVNEARLAAAKKWAAIAGVLVLGFLGFTNFITVPAEARKAVGPDTLDAIEQARVQAEQDAEVIRSIRETMSQADVDWVDVEMGPHWKSGPSSDGSTLTLQIAKSPCGDIAFLRGLAHWKGDDAQKINSLVCRLPPAFRPARQQAFGAPNGQGGLTLLGLLPVASGEDQASLFLRWAPPRDAFFLDGVVVSLEQ